MQKHSESSLSLAVFGTSDLYRGRRIGAFGGSNPGVRGEVFAVDPRTLYLQGFSYDAAATDAFFYAGVAGLEPGGRSVVIPDETGRKEPLGAYSSADLVLTLPPGLTLGGNVGWIGVWRRTQRVSLGHVFVPPDFEPPHPRRIGPLASSLPQGGSSDDVVVLDTQTFFIPAFHYDGRGPDAFFWVGQGSTPSPRGRPLWEEKLSGKPLSRNRGENLVLNLPNLTVFDVDYLAIWCPACPRQDLGHVRIPRGLNVPPSLHMLGIRPETKLNCEILDKRSSLEFRWALAGEEAIVIQLVSKLEKETLWLLGLSGSDERPSLASDDVIVTRLDPNIGRGEVVDYTLNISANCKGWIAGGCPDVLLPGGVDDVRLLTATFKAPFAFVTFERRLGNTGDPWDGIIDTARPQRVTWAMIGSPSYEQWKPGGERLIHLGRRPRWNCPLAERRKPTFEEQNDVALEAGHFPLSGSSLGNFHMRNSSLNVKFAASSRDVAQREPSSFLDFLKFDVSSLRLDSMDKDRPDNDHSGAEKGQDGKTVLGDVVQLGHTPEYFSRWQNITGDSKRYFGTPRRIPVFQLPSPPRPQWETSHMKRKFLDSQEGRTKPTAGEDDERFRHRPTSFRNLRRTRPRSSLPSKHVEARDFESPESSPFSLTEGLPSPRQVGVRPDTTSQESVPSFDVLRRSSLDDREPTVDNPLDHQEGSFAPRTKLRVDPSGPNRLRSHWTEKYDTINPDFTRRPKHSPEPGVSLDTLFEFDPSSVVFENDFHPIHLPSLPQQRGEPIHLREIKEALAAKRTAFSNPLSLPDTKPKVALRYRGPLQSSYDPFYNVYHKEIVDFMKVNGEISVLEKSDLPRVAYHPLPAFKLRPPAPPSGSPFKRYTRRRRRAV